MRWHATRLADAHGASLAVSPRAAARRPRRRSARTRSTSPSPRATRQPSSSTAAPAAVSAPPSGATKESPFPAVARAKLANGMGVDVVTSRALPIVQVRVVVRAGSGYGTSPGVATLTGDMLKDGGTRAMTSAELLRRIETLGANLGVATDFDATVLSMAVTKDQLAEALDILSQVVREPRFDGDELRKLKARTIDEVEARRARAARTPRREWSSASSSPRRAPTRRTASSPPRWRRSTARAFATSIGASTCRRPRPSCSPATSTRRRPGRSRSAGSAPGRAASRRRSSSRRRALPPSPACSSRIGRRACSPTSTSR